MLVLKLVPGVMFAKPLLEETPNVTCPIISSQHLMAAAISVAVKFSFPALLYPMDVDVSPLPTLLVIIVKTGVIAVLNVSSALQTT